MWILIISLSAISLQSNPLQTNSRGIIHVPQISQERCQTERDRISREWTIKDYRPNARCVWIKHYTKYTSAENS